MVDAAARDPVHGLALRGLSFTLDAVLFSLSLGALLLQFLRINLFLEFIALALKSIKLGVEFFEFRFLIVDSCLLVFIESKLST